MLTFCFFFTVAYISDPNDDINTSSNGEPQQRNF